MAQSDQSQQQQQHVPLFKTGKLVGRGISARIAALQPHLQPQGDVAGKGPQTNLESAGTKVTTATGGREGIAARIAVLQEQGHHPQQPSEINVPDKHTDSDRTSLKAKLQGVDIHAALSAVRQMDVVEPDSSRTTRVGSIRSDDPSKLVHDVLSRPMIPRDRRRPRSGVDLKRIKFSTEETSST